MTLSTHFCLVRRRPAGLVWCSAAIIAMRGFIKQQPRGLGATIAAARLYRLDRSAIRTALGLVSSRASGLKSQFGTMGKPFNAKCGCQWY